MSGQSTRYCPECFAAFDKGEERCPEHGLELVDLPADETLVGRMLDGKYEIVEKIGQGGMGTVYRARQKLIGREVALKALRSEITRDPAAAKRFLAEVRAVSQLRSRNSVILFDFGLSKEKVLYYTMEFLAGEPLSKVVRRGPLAPARAVRIARDVCNSLQEAHGKGIVHRDLKPDNIMLVQEEGEEVAKVLDFGIAKMVAGDEDGRLTKTGVVCGTPDYMSPEQGAGKPVGPASDLYSLGVLLYEMLTGKPPFAAATPVMVVMKHISEPPPPVADAAPVPLPVPLQRLVAALLAKDAGDRPGSAREVGALLEGIEASSDTPTAVWDEPSPANSPTAELPASEVPTEPLRDRGDRSREEAAGGDVVLGRPPRTALLWGGIVLGCAALAGVVLYLAHPWSAGGPRTGGPASEGTATRGEAIPVERATPAGEGAGAGLQHVEEVAGPLPSSGIDAATAGAGSVATGQASASLQADVVSVLSDASVVDVALPPAPGVVSGDAFKGTAAEDIRFFRTDSTGVTAPDVSGESARDVRTDEGTTRAGQGSQTSGTEAGAARTNRSGAEVHGGGARRPEDSAGKQDGKAKGEQAAAVEALVQKANRAMDEKQWKTAYEYLKKARSLSDDPSSMERAIQQCRERKAKEDPFDEGDLL